MSFNARYRPNQLTVPPTATGAVPAATLIAGPTVLNEKIANGTSLAAEVSMVVKTSSLTLTPLLQGSVDSSTWHDLYMINSAANVATAAGSGSAVTTARTLCTPSKVPFRFVRVAILTGGATAHATDDTYAIKMHWIEEAFL